MDISCNDRTLDSRDVVKALEEMESEREDLEEKVGEARDALSEHQDNEPDMHDEDWEEKLGELKEALVEAAGELDDWDTDNGEELKALKEFNEEGINATSEWVHGEQVIAESYFEDYCRELCEELGEIPKDIPSYIVIDWAATAENMRHDYSTVTWSGNDFYVRSG